MSVTDSCPGRLGNWPCLSVLCWFFHPVLVGCSFYHLFVCGCLGCIRAVVVDTAVAASALSCWTNDRDSNELEYLLEALRLVDSLLCPEGRDDFKCAMQENSPSTMREEMSVTQVKAVKTEGQVKMERAALASVVFFPTSGELMKVEGVVGRRWTVKWRMFSVWWKETKIDWTIVGTPADSALTHFISSQSAEIFMRRHWRQSAAHLNPFHVTTVFSIHGEKGGETSTGKVSLFYWLTGASWKC